MKKSICFAILAIATLTLSAQRTFIYATASGNWDQPATWNLKRVPANNDSISIPENLRIRLSASKTLTNVHLQIAGTLIIDEAATGNSNDLDIVTIGAKTSQRIIELPGTDARVERGFDNTGTGRIRIRIDNDGNYITKFTTESRLLTGAAIAFNNTSPYFAKNPAGSLVLVMLEFGIATNNKTVTLKWKAQQENNNESYQVERSSDSQEWFRIGEVKAVTTSSVAQSYSFTDQQPINGMNYYRLRMVNKDGKYGITTIKATRIGGNIKDVVIFPNPAHNNASLFFDEKITGTLSVAIYNPNGQLLETLTSSANTNVLSLDLSRFAKGNYFVSIQGSSGFKKTVRLSIQY